MHLYHVMHVSVVDNPAGINDLERLWGGLCRLGALAFKIGHGCLGNGRPATKHIAVNAIRIALVIHRVDGRVASRHVGKHQDGVCGTTERRTGQRIPIAVGGGNAHVGEAHAFAKLPLGNLG